MPAMRTLLLGHTGQKSRAWPASAGIIMLKLTAVAQWPQQTG